MYKIILIVFFSSFYFSVFAQQALDVKTKDVKQGRPLLEYLSDVEKSGSLRFYYLEEWLAPFTMRQEFENLPIKEVLSTLLSESDIQFVVLYDYAVVFFKDPSAELERDAFIQTAITNKIEVERVIIGEQKLFIPGSKVILRGQVRGDDNTGPLAGASVQLNGLAIGTTTDAGGHYQLVLPGGEYVVSFRFINHDEKLVSLNIFEKGELNITLRETPTTLDEVVISDSNTPVTNNRISQTTIKMVDLKRSPSFLGTTDIIKQLQTQPGVTTVSEATSGYNVRGGGADQNLILFDGVPIYNTAHALGFFSAFNADAISDATFYKGGIPAEFGGRVSSVLSMQAKEGNYEKWNTIGSIGAVSSSITTGGPIKRDTSSLIVSLRASYSDWVLNLLKTNYPSLNKGSIFFYDGSIKYSHKLDNRSKLTMSTYTSHDKFRLSNDTTNQWQNIAASVRYDHAIKSNFFYSASLSFGQYGYRVSDDAPSKAFQLDYKITYPSLKLDFNHEGANHRQSFGFQTTYYTFSAGTLKPTTPESNKPTQIMPKERSVESALYISDAFNWTEKFHIEVGLRLSMFNRIGEGTVYKYKPKAPLEPQNTIDSVHYGAGEIMKTYLGPEPRLAIRYTITSQSSIKFGYNRIYQYIHLISNTTSITPVDIWQSSNTYFKPQVADQISLGYFINTKNNGVEAFVEGYYKLLQNVLDFKNGANLILNNQLETALLRGTGKAYGVEISVNKLRGKLVGGINYTYSRSLRQVNGVYDVEKVNDGKQYASNFDQPHIANVNWRYSLSRRFFFSGAFTYHTGRPVSLPIAGYSVDGIPISDFSDRNNYRIPDYHRLDLAFILEGNYTKRKWKGTWTFSVYNVYGRKNPYSVFFVNQGGYLTPYQLSIVGTAVPSISYSFKF